MDLKSKFSDLTGIKLTNANKARFLGAMVRANSILEDLLGFSLDPDERETNQLDTGTPPTFANRIFPLRRYDQYHHIDPSSAVYAVYLLRNNAVDQTFNTDEWSARYTRGIYKYLTINRFLNLPAFYNTYFLDTFFQVINSQYDNFALLVDAQWLFDPANGLPDDLMGVWCEMVTYYADNKRQIKSETLGTHSYSKFQQETPEEIEANRRILQKYAGPRGTINRNNIFNSDDTFSVF